MKGAHFKLLILCLLVSVFANAQVGVGTITPNGMLTIDASAETTAALELVPQATPTTDLANGQLAVIGDKLYMYDVARTKWLSVESNTVAFGSSGGRDDEYLRYAGNITNANSGPIMPFNGTIVGITANSNNGSTTKEFQVEVRNGTTTQSADVFNLVARELVQTTTNIDFNSGDYLKVFINDDTTGNVNNPNVVLFIKWRQ